MLPKALRGTEEYSPSVRSWIARNGEKEIVKMRARRKPVERGIQALMNVVTLGEFEKKAKSVGFDEVYHLGLVLELNDGSQWVLEKLAQIAVSKFDGDWQASVIVPMTKAIRVGEFLERGRKKDGDMDWFTYDAFKNNCQAFVRTCLEANGLWKPHIAEFVLQPAEELVKQLPSWTQRFARTLTDAGAIAERVVYGAGLTKGRGVVVATLKSLA